jgi:DNA-binding SARP family transcriptional activator/Flp pilus assembly protein TadD
LPVGAEEHLSQIKVFLLGSPRLERDGEPAEVDTRKAIALIAYLAVTRQRHGRDALAGLLWPDSDDARAALRRTLSVLNKALGGHGLAFDRESIGLDREAGVWVDLNAFRRRLAATRRHGHAAADVCAECLPLLDEAAALYRGDFLAGFTLADRTEFEEWQFFQAEGLRRDLAGGLERLVRGRAEEGAYEAAIGHARRWLTLDPLHEPAHRELMRLYAFAGQRAAAVRQYRECVRVFEAELGVAPLEETTALYEAIRENRLPVPDLTPRRPLSQAPALGGKGMPPSEPLLDAGDSGLPVLPEPIQKQVPPSLGGKGAGGLGPPLAGRAGELAALAEAYAGVGPDGRLLVLEGEAGIGKTRLAEVFLELARRRDARTVAARCYEGQAGLAFGPFVEGLGAALAQRAELPTAEHPQGRALPDFWLAESARLLPELTRRRPDLPPAPPLDGPGAQSRFFEGVSRFLEALLAGTVPGVLFLDDLQWADEASLELLTYLLRRLEGRPFAILGTWRDEDSPAAGRLRALLAETLRAGRATRLTLARLDRRAVAELVSEAGEAESDELAARLYAESEGLPLFLMEYLSALRSGAASTGAGDWALPSTVRELLARRLATVDETGRQLLHTAAVVGRSFDFDTLREASGRSEEETVNALEALIGQGLVRELRTAPESGTPTYDFSHEKLRGLAYEETSLARRRLLHRRVAEVLAGHARGRRGLGPQAAAIARHYQLAGQEAEAAGYFQLAGDHARALYANAEALGHYRAALALGHPDAAALHAALGDLETLAGDYANAVTSYETAAALARGAALAEIEHKLGIVCQRRGEDELAESHFEGALLILDRIGGGEPAAKAGAQARIFADWSLGAHRRGETEEAQARARSALVLAEQAGDQRALARVHNILGVLASRRGALDEAEHHLTESRRLAEALGDPEAETAALNNLALARGAAGATEEAITLATAALELSVTQGDRHHEAALHNNLADLHQAAGRPETALLHVKRAVAIYAEIGVEAGAVQPEIWKLAEW